MRFTDLPASKRYESLCLKLMDYLSTESQSLEKHLVVERKSLGKLDDGTKEKNPCFDPIATKFKDLDEPTGANSTEELEIKD